MWFTIACPSLNNFMWYLMFIKITCHMLCVCRFIFFYGLLFDTTNRIRIVKCGLLGNQCPQPLLWWWYIPVNLTFPSIFLWLVWGISRTNLLYIFHLYFVIVLPKDAFVIYDTIQPVQAVQQEMQYFFKFLWLNDLTAYTCQFASKTILLSLNKVQCWFLHYVK